VRAAPVPLLLLLLAAAGCQDVPEDLDATHAWAAESHPGTAHLAAAELPDTPGTDTLLVDVREPTEHAVSHLPGAVRATAVEEVLAALKGDHRRVILYCSVGKRSCALAERLAAATAERDPPLEIRNLEKGIFGWAVDGRPLVDGEGKPATKVHPFDESWGRLLPAGLRAPLD